MVLFLVIGFIYIFLMRSIDCEQKQKEIQICPNSPM